MTDILAGEFIVVLLIFMRIAAAFAAAPVFGHSSVPFPAKLGIAFVIALILFLTIEKNNVPAEISLWYIVSMAVIEVVTGLTIGFMLFFVFYAISFAGTFIGFDMGLAMAQYFNPVEGTENNMIGEFLYITSLLIFFLINGHHYIITGLAASYIAVPIGKPVLTEPVFNLLIKHSAAIFVIAIKIASPILVSFFLVHVALGIVARVIPQMQVFFVAQPLKIGIGLLLLAGLIPLYVYFIKNLLQEYERNLFALIKAMSY